MFEAVNFDDLGVVGVADTLQSVHNGFGEVINVAVTLRANVAVVFVKVAVETQQPL